MSLEPMFNTTYPRLALDTSLERKCTVKKISESESELLGAPTPTPTPNRYSELLRIPTPNSDDSDEVGVGVGAEVGRSRNFQNFAHP